MIKMSTPEEKKKLEEEAKIAKEKEEKAKGNEQTIRVIHEFKGEPPEASKKPDGKETPAKAPEKPTAKPDGKTGKSPEVPTPAPTSTPTPAPTKNPKEGEGNKGKGDGKKVQDELAATKLELEQRKNELQIIALKKLEGDVSKWASVVPDEKKRTAIIESIMKSDDPLADFGRKKEMLNMMQQALEIGGIGIKKPDPAANPKEGEGKKPEGTKPEGKGAEGTKDPNPDDVEKAPPKGDVGLPPAAPNQYITGREIIDAAYDILANPQSTDLERAKARKKADELIGQFIAGRRKAIEDNPKHKYYVGYFMCPKCGKAIPATKGAKRATTCNHCGAVLTRRAA